MGREPARRARRRRRRRRRRCRAGRRLARACPSPWSSSATTRAAPPRAPPSWCTADCATSRCSTSRWCARRSRSADCCSPTWRRTSSGRCRSCYPLHHTWERPYVGAGLLLYDDMAAVGSASAVASASMGVPRHRHLMRRGLARVAPDLRTDDLSRRDPLLRLPGRRRPSGDDHRPHGGRLRRPHRLPHQGRRLPARGRPRRRRAGRGPRERPRDRGARPGRRERRRGVDQRDPGDARRSGGALDVEASKGVHLVVPRDRIRSECGFITRTETSVLFVIPWGRHWIIGTTDTPWELDLAHPAASRRDIDYVLEHVNKMLRTPLGPCRRRGGVRRACDRCCAAPPSRPRRSRAEHTVAVPAPGLVIIAM